MRTAAVEDAAWPTAPRQLSSGAEGGETRWWGARVRENRRGGEPRSRGSHLEVEGPACATGKAAPEGLGGVRSTLRASIYVPCFSRVLIFISLLTLEELRIYVVPPRRRPSVVSLPARLLAAVPIQHVSSCATTLEAPAFRRSSRPVVLVALAWTLS